MKIVIATLLATLIATLTAIPTASADCGTVHCQDVSVSRLYAHANASFIRIATSGDESKLSCTADGGYIRLVMSDPNAELIYKSLLAAQLAGRKVWITTRTGANNICEVLYLVLDE